MARESCLCTSRTQRLLVLPFTVGRATQKPTPAYILHHKRALLLNKAHLRLGVIHLRGIYRCFGLDCE